MHLRPAYFFACLATGIGILCFANPATASTVLAGTEKASSGSPRQAEVPDAPVPAGGQAPAAQPAQPVVSQPMEQAPDQKASAQDEAKRRHDLAEEQIKQQQKQRVAGVVPNFNTSYVYDAASLTAGQKFKLAFRSAIDPVQMFGVAPFVALLGQAEGSHYGYGGGMQGYGKRYGQTYADNFNGAMLGNAILPSILHQDPRYFRLGRGSVKRRLLYALGTNVLSRHDVTGKWEPNWSNVLGNLASGGISNIYLPKDERGISSTITGGFTVTAEGGLGSMFQEFWPDISRHFLHKDPTHGQDAIDRSKPDPTGGGNPFSRRRPAAAEESKESSQPH